MKFLFKLIILLVLVSILVVGGVLGFIYFTYLQIQPAEFSLSGEVADITSVEYARFTFTNEGLVPDKIGVVKEVDSFLNDFNKLDAHTGINVNDLNDLLNGKPIDGIVINYSDGSYEFITPYICVNSKFNPKTVNELLSTRIHGFDGTQFSNLIDNLKEYSLEIPAEDLDKIEDALDKTQTQ